MREYRKFGYLMEYKQRKQRDLYDPNSWKYIYSPISEYWKKKKEKETKEEKKRRLEVMNKLRVERHRSKVKKKLLEPLIIENNEKKSEYELLRDRNIEEFERKKKESGLFD